MNDSLLEDDKLTTADIARPATVVLPGTEPINPNPAQPDRIDQPDTQPIQLSASTSSNAISDAGPLFPDDELHNFRARWDQVQTSFVDEPRKAVEQADSLVANAVKRIAEQFAAERAKLEAQWAKGDNVNTEDLRLALKRYRSFFDRLLAF